MGDGRPVAFDGTDRKMFCVKQVDEKIRYSPWRGIEWINLPAVTPIREHLPLGILDSPGGFPTSCGDERGRPRRKAFLSESLPDNGQTCSWNRPGLV